MLLMAVWGTAWGDDATFFDATAQGYGNAQEVEEWNNADGGYVITFDKGSNSNAPKYYTSGKPAVRVYGGNTITVKTTEPGTALTQVVIGLAEDNTANEPTANTGNITYVKSETYYRWDGSGTDEVTFTVGGTKGHLKVQSITIYRTAAETSTIAAPVFSPAAGEVEAGTEVTISNASSSTDYEIYYTLDGSSPIGNNNALGGSSTETVTINEAVTIKAVCVDDEGNTSSVTTAAYTVKSTEPEVVIPNIAAFRSEQPTSPVTLRLDGAEVLGVNGQNIYVRDANSGTASAISFYQSGQSWKAGDILTGTLKAKLAFYNNLLPEATTFSDIDVERTAGDAPQVKVVDVADATIDNYVADYIQIEGSVTKTGNYYYIGDVQLYVNNNVTAANSVYGGNVASGAKIADLVSEGKTYIVQGILVPFNNHPELLLLNVKEVTDEVTIAAPIFSPAAGEVEEGTVVTISNASDTDYEIYYTLDGSSPVGNNAALGGNSIETVTISEAVTIKAVCVDDEGNVSDVAEAAYTVKEEPVETEEPAEAELGEGIFFFEDFSQVNGTGGTDGSFSGQVASSDIFGNSQGGKTRTTDMIWESLSKDTRCYGANECMRFGTGNDNGEFKTREIEVPGVVTLSFAAAGWATGTNKLTVELLGGYLFDDGSATQTITLENSSWTRYEYTITQGADAAGNLQVSFTGKRGFIDGIIVYEAEALVVNAPTISPEGGVFTDPVQVEITSDQEEAVIYYTTDGSTPTNESTQYVEPFEVSETTTVKAIAYIEDTPSSVVSQTYEFMTVCNSIAEFRQLEVGTTAVLRLNGAQVLAAAGNNVYVRDNGDDLADAICFYQCKLDAETGQLLYGQLVGKRADYNGLPEVTNATDVSLDARDDNADFSWARELTADEVNLDDYVADLIRFEGEVTKNGNNYYIGETQLYVDNYVVAANDVYEGNVAKGDKVADLVEEGKTYTVTGILTSFRNNPELYLLNVEEKPEIVEVEYAFNSYGIGTLYYGDLRFNELPSGVTASVVSGIQDNILVETALADNSGMSFIPAGCAVILHGDPNSTVVLEGTAADNEELPVSNLLRGTDEEETIDLASAVYYYYVLSAKNGKVGFYWATEGGGSFVNAAHRAYLPLTPEQAAQAPAFFFDGTTGIGTVETATMLDSNAPMFNLAGQRVTSSYKGVVIQNGKKVVK